MAANRNTVSTQPPIGNIPRPRVLFIDHAGVLGGGQYSLLDIARHFASSCKVLLFADGPFRERLQQYGVSVEVLPAPRKVSGVSRQATLLQDLRAVAGVIHLARSVAKHARDYDLIYANGQKPMVVSAFVARLANKPLIWHLRDTLTVQFESRLHLWLATTLANLFVARVIANSKATAEAFVQSGGRADRVQTVYNGIDAASFRAVTPEQVASARLSLGLGSAPVIGAFGRLAPWKGQHVLLEAMPQLPGVHVLFVGDAIFGEDAYARKLREQAAALGVTDRAHFLGFRQDIPLLMSAVDMVVHTAVEAEPFGRVLVEGMLARKPVVATRGGGTPEIIETGVSGLLVPPSDVKTLVAAIGGLLADPASAQKLAEAGHAVALQRFSLEALLAGVTRQIDDVLARRR
ncbi:MAG: glycosyltransferase family 4 protein [Verrucomicrobia bacterium]|nr:glycosyltransferase family 4 protein [Verrucomicrobiota bacterium]